MDSIADPQTALLSSLFTNAEASGLLEQLGQSIDKLYLVERKSILSLLDETFPEEQAMLLKEYLKNLHIIPTHHEEVRQALIKLQEEVKKMRSLSLTLAIPLATGGLHRIGEWAKKEFGPDVYLEVTVNPDLIAGGIFVFEGRYLDLSVRKKLDILFEAKREEIVKLLS